MVVEDAVEAFRLGEEYPQEVLVSRRDVFLESFELCKRWATKRFLGIDIKKLMMGSPSGSSEGFASFDREGMEASEDPASLP